MVVYPLVCIGWGTQSFQIFKISVYTLLGTDAFCFGLNPSLGILALFLVSLGAILKAVVECNEFQLNHI